MSPLQSSSGHEHGARTAVVTPALSLLITAGLLNQRNTLGCPLLRSPERAVPHYSWRTAQHGVLPGVLILQ